MSEKLTIGLLSPFFQPIPGYEQAAINLDMNLVIVTPKRVDWAKNEVAGLLWNGQEWVRDSVSIPRSLYNRYYGPKPKIVSRLELVIGKDKIFNHVTRFNKWTIHQVLSKSSLQPLLPYTACYTPKRLLDMLDRFGQVILKPTSGQLGTKIYLVKQVGQSLFLHQGTTSPVAEFSSAADLLLQLESMTEKNFLVQKFIPLARAEGRIFDIRLLVQKSGSGLWQVTGAASRHALRYSYVSNFSWAVISARETLLKTFPQENLFVKLESISIRAAQTVEKTVGSLGEVSVDFGLDNKGNIWIIELNAKPMKNIFNELDDANVIQTIYEQPLRYARHLAMS